MALLLLSDGSSREVTPTTGPAFTLAELQSLVGGYIEVVRAPSYGGPPRYLVLNEDGKRDELPINRTATAVYWTAGGAPDDYIVGNVVVCTLVELGADRGDG